jgi:hypothetical protein
MAMARAAMFGALVFVLAACSRRRDDQSGAPAASAAHSAASAGTSQPAGSESSTRGAPFDGGAGPGRKGPSEHARAGASAEETPFPADAGKLVLRLDKPIDLGPAGGVVATPMGALFRSRGDDLVGFSVGGSPTGAPKRVGRTDDPGAAGDEEALASHALPPAFTRGSYAYWVSHGKLVRRSFGWSAGAPLGSLEVLATDALDGTRVAAETVTVAGAAGQRREVAIYIARTQKKTDERGARVWVEGAGSAPLSSDGSGASSVAMASSDRGLVAVMLDARSAMSPVHARTIEVDERGPARLGPDVVVFVGPSPEGHTEVAAAPSSEGPIAFIPFAQDTSSFGLSSLFIGTEPHLDADVHWRMYPNGLEPAPAAGAALCGRTWVAYARPSAAAPASPHVLVLAPTEKGAFGPELMAAQGFDFASVSLAPRDEGGGWLAWVGNGRSWIRAVRCG